MIYLWSQSIIIQDNQLSSHCSGNASLKASVLFRKRNLSFFTDYADSRARLNLNETNDLLTAMRGTVDTSYQLSGIRMTESSKKRPSKSLNNSISSTPLRPSAKMVKVSDESDVSISKLFELVSDMNKKLDKLDCIEIHLSRVDKDIADLKESVSFVHGSTDEIKKEQSMSL